MKGATVLRPRHARRRAIVTSSAPPVPSGKVVERVSRFDAEQRYYAYVPASGGDKAPVFVTVHGLSRNAREHARLLAPMCEAHGAVLVAPLFTEEHARDYQRLGREGKGVRADVALEAILEEVSFLTGADTAPIHLFGFSGGAQFAHRFAMAWPQRVARAAIASSGWYTFPDGERRYPYGTRRSRELPDVRFDPEEFLQVPITVFVGDRDTTAEDLRATPKVNEQQGLHRLERAQNWVRAMQDLARAHQLESRVTFEAIAGGDHSFTNLMQTCGLGERVFAALFGLPLSHTRAEHNGNGNGIGS